MILPDCTDSDGIQFGNHTKRGAEMIAGSDGLEEAEERLTKWDMRIHITFSQMLPNRSGCDEANGTRHRRICYRGMQGGTPAEQDRKSEARSSELDPSARVRWSGVSATRAKGLATFKLLEDFQNGQNMWGNEG